MSTTTPDTPTARAAAALAQEAAPAFLVNHSYRTYLFGAAVVTKDVDHEAGFVAAMIHDLGLTDAHRGDSDFGEVGAEVAARFLEGRGWDRGRIRLVERAILRHTKLIPEGSPTARVVQLGAQIDVAGRGMKKLDEQALTGILRAYPRLDFARQMRAVYLDEVQRQPKGSFAKLERTVHLSDRFERNPIDQVV
ncbi:HD domain-containing protein [Nocardioides sp. CCNWLW239]|uniref:HD domain-containing protein n=1 Tax=Nocardioides sp. CCNWLW239 TaxID=3128902 RepID=UPI003016589A